MGLMDLLRRRRTPELEYSDRYGGQWPDADTVCPGPCEGTGVYPAYSPDHDTRNPPIPGAAIGRAMDDDSALIAAAGATPGDDGWAFLTCPECGGSGKRVVA